jgi:hypothetical protein
MFFGVTTFAGDTFAGPGGVSVTFTVTGSEIQVNTGSVAISASARVLPNGNEIEVTIGNVTVTLPATVLVTGVELELANNVVNVINWNPIPPGASQTWVEIDPLNP